MQILLNHLFMALSVHFVEFTAETERPYIYNVLYKSFCNNNLPTILESAGLARLEVEIESLFDM